MYYMFARPNLYSALSQLSFQPRSRVKDGLSRSATLSPNNRERNRSGRSVGNSRDETKRHSFHNSAKLQVIEDRNTKAVTVWGNVREVKRSPFPALILGLAGLSPFIAGPAYMTISQVYLPDIAFAQVAYGATILSFLGGVRWGFVLPEENPVKPDWINLSYSVMPSLVAWAGLLLPYPASLFTMMGGLTAAAYMDMVMYGYPPWFKGLRFVLSFVAILSLWTTFMCSFMLSAKDTKPAKSTGNNNP